MSNSELFPFIVLLHGKYQLFHYIENSYTEIQIVKMTIYRIPSEFNLCKLVIFIFDFHHGSNCSGICHWLTNRSTMNQLTFQSFKRSLEVMKIFEFYKIFETILILETRIFPLRSPRTKEIASIRFDFPDPFGPIIEVNRPNGPILIWPL